jgi:hypothetical protein
MKTTLTRTIAMAMMIFLIQSARAQFNYGVHAGLNLVTQAEMGELWNNCDVYHGYTIGGVIEYKTRSLISFQTELNYQKKGAKTDSESDGITYTAKKEFNYLSVPLLIRATINDKDLGDKYDLSFFAGPYAGYLTSTHSRINSGAEDYPADLNDQAEKFDAGAVFGGGIIYKLENGKAITGELRYEMGLKSIDKLDTGLRNKGLGISVGYRF